jgi:hypothetical protein
MARAARAFLGPRLRGDDIYAPNTFASSKGVVTSSWS